MKKLLYSLAGLCMFIFTACGPSHAEMIDKLGDMYKELDEIVAKDGPTSQAAVDKYGEIMNYQMDLGKYYPDFTSEERDYYTKVNTEGVKDINSETVMAYYARQNGEDFGTRPEDKDVLDQAKGAVDDAVEGAKEKANAAVEDAKDKANAAVEDAKAKAADAVNDAVKGLK